MSPSSATSQRTGRAKRVSSSSHRMVFGNAMRVATDSSSPGSTSTAGRPLRRSVTSTYSPRGVWTRFTALGSTPLPLQKPSSAGVGLPSAS